MTTCMSDHAADKFWRGAALGCEAGLAPWLRDRGSLTQRIQRRCTNFAVRNVRSGLARIAPDESALLGIAPQQLAWSREVFLYADGQAVVFAHSALAVEHLRGVWSEVRTLENKPLGALLFAHPLVERRPLHYQALRNTTSLIPACRRGADRSAAQAVGASFVVLSARCAVAGHGSVFAGNIAADWPCLKQAEGN